MSRRSNSFQFTTKLIDNCLSKGEARINVGNVSGPTHKTGFYSGIIPPLSGYVFYIQKDVYFDNNLLLFLDSTNKSSYRNDLSSDEWWDLSGYENDITLYNKSYNSINNSLEFSTGKYGKTDNVIVTSPSGLTIGGWFMKKSAAVTYNCVLHQSSDTSIGLSSYWFGTENFTDNIVATIGAGTGLGWNAGLTTSAATYYRWYNVVASWDGSVVRVYINGEYNKQYNLSTYSDLSTPTRIGASGDANTYQFTGEIGEVWIYNSGLTSEQILQNYNNSKLKYNFFYFGYTTIYGTSTSVANLRASSTTVSIDSKIESVTIYHLGGTDNLLLGIYEDSGGTPTSLLMGSPSVPINATIGWQTVELTSPLSVISGQTIWIGYMFQTNPGMRYQAGTPGRAQSTATWASTGGVLPTTFITPTFSDFIYSVYCTARIF